jgi:membrane-bound ClpP family serine protease
MHPLLILAPNEAILLLSLGIALLYVELNRPGWIVPGMVGLLATLLALASLYETGIRSDGAMLLLAGLAIEVFSLRRVVPHTAHLAAVAATSVGLGFLAKGEQPRLGLVCGLILGTGTWYLVRIAHRARRNKGLD